MDNYRIESASLVLFMTTCNDAFIQDPSAEVARILRQQADMVEKFGLPNDSNVLYDINGNKVGEFVYESKT